MPIGFTSGASLTSSLASQMELGVKSAHPGGAYLLFGDGSVHFTDESIDMWTYQYLGAKADGEVAVER